MLPTRPLLSEVITNYNITILTRSALADYIHLWKSWAVCTLVNCMFSMMIATLQTNDGDLNIQIIHREKFLDKNN